MASPTIVDMLSRTTSMAEGKKNWIKKAIPKGNRGKFKAKAEAAGETTREYAAEKKDAPGALGKEARLAQNLMGMKRKSKMYSHPSSAKGMSSWPKKKKTKSRSRRCTATSPRRRWAASRESPRRKKTRSRLKARPKSPKVRTRKKSHKLARRCTKSIPPNARKCTSAIVPNDATCTATIVPSTIRCIRGIPRNTTMWPRGRWRKCRRVVGLGRPPRGRQLPRLLRPPRQARRPVGLLPLLLREG